MKVKVMKEYNDRFTKERKEFGKTYDYADEARVAELVKSGNVEIVDEKPSAKPKTKSE